MARYLSKYSSMKKTVRKAQQTLVQGPQGPFLQVMEPAHIAIFAKAGVTPWERDFALKHFGFTGVADGEDPIGRLSLYDTDAEADRHGWTPEEKAEIEAVLDAGVSSDYFRVEKPRLTAPWPSYDDLLPQGRRTAELVAEQIAETVKTLGLDAEGVIAYELENRNRPEVIEALQSETELVVQA